MVRCLADCNAPRGACRAGVCICADGFTGIDCHPAPRPARKPEAMQPSAAPPAPPPDHIPSQPPARRPRIYVYDRPVPEDVHTFWRRDLGHDAHGWGWSEGDSIYLGGAAFLSRLLRDPHHRTHEAAEADLFLLPLDLRLVGNTQGVVASRLIQHWIERWLLRGHARGPLHRHIWWIATDECAAFGSEQSRQAFGRWFGRHGGLVRRPPLRMHAPASPPNPAHAPSRPRHLAVAPSACRRSCVTMVFHTWLAGGSRLPRRQHQHAAVRLLALGILHRVVPHVATFSLCPAHRQKPS